jgi:hypothetical protein
MGIQGLLFGKGGAISQSKGGNISGSGNHAIDHQRVLKATDGGAISPDNPGNFSSIRSVPVVQSPRYFSPEEAGALSNLEKEKATGAVASIRAYKKLAKIEKHDATVHRAHRKYESKVADCELEKKQADARHARHLHTIRPDYERMAVGLQRAEANANQRISELRSKVTEAWK